MKKMHLSLNQKLIGITVISFIAINFLLMVNEYQTIKNEIVASRMERVVNVSDAVKSGIISLMLQGSCNDIGSFLRQRTGHSTRVETLRLFNPVNRLIQTSILDSEVGMRLPDESYDLYLKHKSADPHVTDDNAESSVIRYLSFENTPPCHKCHGSKDNVLGVLEIKYSLNTVMSSVQHIIFNQVIFSLLSIVLFTLLFAYIVIRLIDEPLKHMMETINDIEQGDLNKKVVVRSNDIIGILSSKFNNMVTKISEARDALENVHKTQMKRASQLASIGEIASGIAHEIKNPLACISGALQVIQGRMEDNDEHKPVLRDVLNQVSRLDSTVKRILEFAKPTKAQKAVVDVHEVIRETLFFINQYANRKAIDVQLFPGKDVKAIYADGRALKQVLLNICLNGIEAMGEKGILHISTAVKPRCVAGGEKNYIDIKIKDAGCGISQEHIALVFDPFFTTKEKGTGLGLSICMQIVEEHDGFIEVESAVGEGTTFRISLPAPERELTT
jgi:signal transduction histidine kinase